MNRLYEKFKPAQYKAKPNTSKINELPIHMYYLVPLTLSLIIMSFLTNLLLEVILQLSKMA